MKEGIRAYEGGVLFDIVVKPNARKQGIKVSKKSGIVISVTSPPVGGSANRELMKYLKTILGRDTTIHQTHKNHRKTMYVSAVSVEQFKQVMSITW